MQSLHQLRNLLQWLSHHHDLYYQVGIIILGANLWPFFSFLLKEPLTRFILFLDDDRSALDLLEKDVDTADIFIYHNITHP